LANKVKVFVLPSKKTLYRVGWLAGDRGKKDNQLTTLLKINLKVQEIIEQV